MKDKYNIQFGLFMFRFLFLCKLGLETIAQFSQMRKRRRALKDDELCFV